MQLANSKKIETDCLISKFSYGLLDLILKLCLIGIDYSNWILMAR